MKVGRRSDPAARKARTTAERASERELVITRTVDRPARIVFEAWSRPELFRRWWGPSKLTALEDNIFDLSHRITVCTFNV